MTRAQIRIFSKIQGIEFLYGIHSNGYSDRILPILKRYKGDINYIGNDLSTDVPGNPSYYYELDCDTGVITCRDAVTYWCNAPKDWKEKGWNCWMGNHDSYGYTNWRKGKIEWNIKEPPAPIRILPAPHAAYNHEAIKALKQASWCSWGLKQLLKRRTTTPDVLHTYIYADEGVYNSLYVTPFEDVPLHINHEEPYKDIYTWRLKLGS